MITEAKVDVAITYSARTVAVSVASASGATNLGTKPGETNNTQTKVERDSLSSGIHQTVNVQDRWNVSLAGRFKTLARKEALEDLSVDEHVELEKLTRLRRLAEHPRSADEILWQRKQQRLTQSLISALKEYVDFHEAPRSS